MGRNCQVQFWCGFCIKLIALKKRGLEAWTERFDHIDDDFRGNHGLKKQSIQDWIPVNSNKPTGEVEIPLPLNASLGSEDHSDSAFLEGNSPESTVKCDEKWLKNSGSFIVAVRQTALDTGQSSQIAKGMVVSYAEGIEIVTNRSTPEEPLQHTSEYKQESQTQKSWFPNRVNSCDPEMGQQENRPIGKFHVGSFPRGGTLFWRCFVVLAVITLVLLLK